MNKVALISSKILFGAVFLTNMVIVSVIVFLKWYGSFNLDLESAMLDSTVSTVFILQNIAIVLLILGLVSVSILCNLSRKKWLVIFGTIISFLAAAYAGYLALLLAIRSFTVLAVFYSALSVGVALLAYFSMRQLASGYINKPALMKPIGLILAVILVVAATWLTDESLDPDFHRVYTDRQMTILDKENVAVGLAGLNAPVGSNFMDVGLASFKSAQLSAAPVQRDEVSAKAVTINSIKFVGSSEEINCWIGNQDSGDKPSECASEKRLNEILRANAVLLSRYRQLTQIPHFQGIHRNGDLFLNINRLIAAEVQLKLRHGRYEDAYQEWRENHLFVNRMIGENTGWVDKAILAVANSFSLASAEALIHSFKGIASIHGDELMTMLEHSGLARWNLPGVLRSEYDLWLPIFSTYYNSQFWFHQNFIRNKWLHFQQAFLNAANAPPDIASKKMQAVLFEFGGFRSWSNNYLRDPLNTVLVRGYLLNPQNFNVVELIRAMHIQDAQQRTLTLALLIKRKNLKDGEIANFLASVDPSLKNPFTGNSMEWDAKKRVIRLVIPHQSNSGDDVIKEVRL